MYEDTGFKDRQLAALVASKVLGRRRSISHDADYLYDVSIAIH